MRKTSSQALSLALILTAPVLYAQNTVSFDRFLQILLQDPERRKATTATFFTETAINLINPEEFSPSIFFWEKTLTPEVIGITSTPKVIITYITKENDKFTYLSKSTFKNGKNWFLTSTTTRILPKITVSNKEKATNCLQKAQRISNPEKFDLKLDYLICAAHYGSTQAAYSAATLSQSGQNYTIPTSYAIQLLKQAATEIPEARTALAETICGDGPLCLSPKESEVHIENAINSGDKAAANTLGNWLEHGKLGYIDLQRAMACYQASIEVSAFAKSNYTRLQKNKINPTACTK